MCSVKDADLGAACAVQTMTRRRGGPIDVIIVVVVVVVFVVVHT